MQVYVLPVLYLVLIAQQGALPGKPRQPNLDKATPAPWNLRKFDFTPQKVPNNYKVGPKHRYNQTNWSPNVVEVFKSLWNDHVTHHVAQTANHYGIKFGKEIAKTIDKKGIDIYHATLLAMTLNRQADFDDYWATCEHGLLGNLFVRHKLSRQQFECLRRCVVFKRPSKECEPPHELSEEEQQWKDAHAGMFHSVNERENPTTPHRYLEQPYIATVLRHAFQQAWNPSPKLAGDEAMCPFRGRVYIRVYKPRKPTRNGIEIWCLCDASGYCWDFIVNFQNQWTMTEVIQRLLSDLPRHKNDPSVPEFEVYVDQLFGCEELADWLRKEGFHFVMVCKKDHPTYLWNGLQCNLKKDETAILGKKTPHGPIFAQSYHSTSIVNILSSSYDPFKRFQKQECQKRRSGEVTSNIPESVKEYRKNKLYVDKLDSFMARYPLQHRFKYWHHALYFWFLLLTVVNSWIIWRTICLKHHKRRGNGLRTYIRLLAIELAGDHTLRKRGVTGVAPKRYAGVIHCPRRYGDKKRKRYAQKVSTINILTQ